MDEQTFRHPFQEEPLILNTHCLELLFSQENPTDLIGLYIFYYYTAKQQNASAEMYTKDIAKKLNWTEDKVEEIRDKIIETGLIKEEQGKLKISLGW